MRDILHQHAKIKHGEKKSGTPASVYGAMLGGYGNITTSRWDRQNILSQAYERNAAFYSAVNIIAQTVADLPIKVRVTHNGKTQYADKHPILNLFERNETRAEFIGRFTQYFVALGTAYAEIVMNYNNQKPLGLVVMPSQFTRNIQGDYRRPIIAYEYVENKVVRIDEKHVVHLYRPSLAKYFEELSPAVPLAELISLNNAAITWNKNLAQKGGLPQIIGYAEGLDETEAKQTADNWEAQSGANQAHRLRIVGGVLKLEKLTDTPNDAEWEQAVLTSMRMIFMALGVSSSLMNDAGNKTYNNVHDARKALFTENTIPLAKRIYQAFTRKLQHYYEDNPEIVVDTQNVEAIQEDKKATVDRLVHATSGGIMTPNEARAELGLQPVDSPIANMLMNSSTINNIPKADVNGDSIPIEEETPELDPKQNPEEDENQN